MRSARSRGARAARIAGILAVGLLASPALAYFGSGGQASATATVGSIIAPAQVTLQQTGADLGVTWTAATLAGSGAVQGYTVVRSDATTVCGSPTPSTGLSCADPGVPLGTYTYTVKAVYHSFSASIQSVPFTVLTSPTVSSGPSDPSASTAPSFSFADGGGSSYECALDGGALTSCTSPKSYTALPAGSHTFAVHAMRGTSVGPATSRTWTVDATAPTITAKPADPTSATTAAFSFSHSRSTYTFACRLDTAAFAACPSPTSYSALPDGSHTFQVEAVSADGAATPVASYTWRLDATAPTSSLSGSGGLVVWANNTTGTIGEANLDASSPNQSVVSGAQGPLGIATDGSHLFWSNINSSNGMLDTIGRANLDGSGVNQSFLSAPYVWSVTADADHLYWTSTGYYTIGRANLDGTGANQYFISGANGPVSVAVNGTYVYWANINNKTIGRANLDGTGAVQNFMTLATATQGLAVDATHLYWTTGNAIARSNLDGSSTSLSFVPSAPGASSVAVDAGHIYWTNSGGTIGRANLDGTGAVGSFISGAHAPRAVAVAPAPTNWTVAGGTVYYRGSSPGSVTLVDTVTDAGTGPASVTFPAISTTGWAHDAQTVSTGAGTVPSIAYSSSSFTWTANPADPSGYALTATDGAGTTSSFPVAFVNDSAGPTGGALSVNGTAATSGGSTSTAVTSGFAIDSRTDYSESQSASSAGLKAAALTVQSASLSGGTCGAAGSAGPFLAPVTVTGTTQPAGITAGYCYVYTLSGIDKVGNTTSMTTTAKVPL